jgi:hypothetical protein
LNDPWYALSPLPSIIKGVIPPLQSMEQPRPATAAPGLQLDLE